MSWILKQAEDILNRVDQQTNAAINQHQVRSTSKNASNGQDSDSSSYATNTLSGQQTKTSRTNTGTRRSKKDEEADLIDYLNSSTPADKKLTRSTNSNTPLSDATRTASSPNMVATAPSLKMMEPGVSKSASGTPRSTTPAGQTHDEDEGLVLNIPLIEESTDDQPLTQGNENSDLKGEVIAGLNTEIKALMREKRQYEQELQTYKRQQTQYQHQIAESDALLRDLRSREADSVEALNAKDTQIALLRVRLTESDEVAKSKTLQCEQLQNQCARILQDHTDSSGLQSQAFDSLQSRLTQLEHESQQRNAEYERVVEEKHLLERRFTDERQQLLQQLKAAEKRLNDERLLIHDHQQQTKQAKNQIHQLEQDMTEYKAKAQRILQTKDKLIAKLKEIAQNRTNSSNSPDIHDFDTLSTSDDPSLIDVHLVTSSPNKSLSTSTSSHWSSVQYEELKAENELFKQELQAREVTIHTLRNELQEAESLVQHADEQLHEQTNQLNEQLQDERSRLTLAEQDCRKLKQELNYMHEESHRQKQAHLAQLSERERELERLRLQLTAKTINHVNDDELEKRLQALTESLIQKQTIIEALQTDKSSLSMQLERLEKRLDEYDRISSTTPITNSFQSSSSSRRLQATTIPMDMDSNGMYDNENEDTLRARIPMLRETPYDPDIAKKVKRAANELDRLGIRLGVFLKRYPAVRLGVIFYAILLHLWTLIVLFTYTPEVHGSTHPLDASHKL